MGKIEIINVINLNFSYFPQKTTIKTTMAYRNSVSQIHIRYFSSTPF